MKSSKEKLNEALRHVHYAQGYAQSVNATGLSTANVTKQVILGALDTAEIHIIRLRAELNES